VLKESFNGDGVLVSYLGIARTIHDATAVASKHK
jgi:hypothetical protein